MVGLPRAEPPAGLLRDKIVRSVTVNQPKQDIHFTALPRHLRRESLLRTVHLKIGSGPWNWAGGAQIFRSAWCPLQNIGPSTLISKIALRGARNCFRTPNARPSLRARGSLAYTASPRIARMRWRHSPTTLSGVDAPDVMPMTTGPSGRKPSSTSRPWSSIASAGDVFSGLCSMVLAMALPRLMRSAQSMWYPGTCSSSAISRRCVVFEELKPPTTMQRSTLVCGAASAAAAAPRVSSSFFRDWSCCAFFADCSSTPTCSPSSSA
mmetsp:Transcript_5506/g.16266  ORF Transcript_5506/g.16266 Transcript_5506/m.16266 type:complete len:265 (-) Transcript_5506:1092-1886(-)